MSIKATKTNGTAYLYDNQLCVCIVYDIFCFENTNSKSNQFFDKLILRNKDSFVVVKIWIQKIGLTF